MYTNFYEDHEDALNNLCYDYIPYQSMKNWEALAEYMMVRIEKLPADEFGHIDRDAIDRLYTKAMSDAAELDEEPHIPWRTINGFDKVKYRISMREYNSNSGEFTSPEMTLASGSEARWRDCEAYFSKYLPDASDMDDVDYYTDYRYTLTIDDEINDKSYEFVKWVKRDNFSVFQEC